jgi:hypothetical protein
MTEMIERVKAVLALYVPEPIAEQAARAAIKAMREPTPGMMRKAEGYSDFMLPDETHDNTVEGRRAEMRMAYQCAIDAALAPNPTP